VDLYAAEFTGRHDRENPRKAFGRRSGRVGAVHYGVASEFVHAVKAQPDENSVAVGFDGARAYFHGGGNLFGGLADAQEAVYLLLLVT
jgi:hypothetical protein